jgi:hypothetical protein
MNFLAPELILHLLLSGKYHIACNTTPNLPRYYGTASTYEVALLSIFEIAFRLLGCNRSKQMNKYFAKQTFLLEYESVIWI